MNRLLSYILNENASELYKLEDKLKSVFGITEKQLRELYKSVDGNSSNYLKELQILHDKYENENNENLDISKDDLPLSGHDGIHRDYEAPEKEKPVADDAVVSVLEYLSKLWRNKDRVRVIAARFKLDPDVYLAAGLGNLPSDYKDEDVWNTMDASRGGNVEFKDSIWQPFYIESLERLKELPEEVKADIAEILQKSKEDKKAQSYPRDSNNPFKDDGTAYESKAKLVDSIMVEGKDGYIMIDKGTIVVY
jgi:hypothetical protein